MKINWVSDRIFIQETFSYQLYPQSSRHAWVAPGNESQSLLLHICTNLKAFIYNAFKGSRHICESLGENLLCILALGFTSFSSYYASFDQEIIKILQAILQSCDWDKICENNSHILKKVSEWRALILTIQSISLEPFFFLFCIWSCSYQDEYMKYSWI